MKRIVSGVAILASVILLQGCITYKRITTTDSFGETVVLDSSIGFEIPENVKRKFRPLRKELDRRTLARGSEIGFWSNVYSLMDLFADEFIACQRAEAETIGCGKSWYRENHKFYLLTPSCIDN